MKNKNLLLLLAIVIISKSSFSQDKKTIGISGTIQGSQFGIVLPVWLGDKFVLAPAFEFKAAEGIGTELGLGLNPRFYTKKEKLSPYFGLRAGVIINTPSSKNTIETSTKTDVLAGLAFGAEYFLSDNFSFGVEIQGNFTISNENSNRFGNPDGVNFNTGTMVSATVYF